MIATRQTPTSDAGAIIVTHLATGTASTPKSSPRDIAEPVPTNQTLISVLLRKHSRCHYLAHEQVELARLQQLVSLRGC